MMDATKRAGLVQKIQKAWKLWNDAATPEASKDAIRSTIQKALDQLNEFDIDWTTGKLTKKGTSTKSQSASQAKTGTTPPKQDAKKEAPKAKSSGQWSTKELADYLSKLFGKEMTPKALRRILRSMPRYDDKKMTHYAWNGSGDPMVQEIVDFMKGKKTA